MHTRLVVGLGESSSISGLVGCSPSDLAHDFSISLVDRQEESREISKSSFGCGEMDNFLNAVKMNSS